MTLDDFNYDVTDNGDGTFSVVFATIDTAALITEYRAIRDRGLKVLARRNDFNTELATLVARRDDIRAILVASGVVDPDND